MTSYMPKGQDPADLEDDFEKEWGEDSLLEIEADLEGLDVTGEFDDSGEPVTGQGDEDSLADLDLELDEWEEYVDSQWNKLIE